MRPPAGRHFAAPFGPQVAVAAAAGAWRGIVAGMATGLARRSVRRVAADRGTLLGLIPTPAASHCPGRPKTTKPASSSGRVELSYSSCSNRRSRNAAGWLT